MKIYSFPTFNLTKLLLTAEELGLDYSLHLMQAESGEHKGEAHLARHPLGKVPAIEYDGEYYYESNAICRFLAEENNNQLYSANNAEKARINQWMDLFGYHIGRWMGVLFFQEAIKPKLLGGQPDQAATDEAAGFLKEQLPLVNEALSKHDFLTGDTFTLADIIAFSYCQTAQYSSLNFDEYPAINRWYDAIKNRPSLEKAMSQLPNNSVAPFPT